MIEFIRFNIVEIDSQVWFMSGDEKYTGFKVISFVLIPSYLSGIPVITEVNMPEIFLQ
jgi:hypothetical protein